MTRTNPQKNRLSYSDLLAPEPEFALKKAITTTYSLDLQTLIASTLPLAIGEATDSELAKNHINLLHALQKVTGKMLVFCESSQIKSMKKDSQFIELLSKCVLPVKMQSPTGNHPSFHPKCWLLQYQHLKDASKKQYKFIVMSRNLSFDRSWDIAVCLEGKQTDAQEINPQTQRIIAFMDFLSKQIDEKDARYDKNIAFINELKADLQNVVFETADDDFYDFEVLPLGIGTLDINKDELFSGNAKHITVMSPFVSKGIVEKLLCNKWSAKLITRKSELEKICDLPRDFSVYCLSDNIIDGEEIASEDDAVETMPQDIHAKIYSLKLPKHNLFYIGSMNASHNGANRNVELMLKLYSNNYSPDRFEQDLELYGKMFLREDLSNYNLKLAEIEDIEELAERTIKAFCRLQMSAEIMQNTDGKYDITITVEDFQHLKYDIKNIKISPFFAKALCQSVAQKIVFNGLNEKELSEFYNISIALNDEKIIERTIKISTIGMPDEREKNIVKDIISNKKRLAEYIAFVLGDNTLSAFDCDLIDILEEDAEELEKSSSKHSDEILTPIYERMLKTAYTNPERLKDVEDIISLIDDDKIVTPEFKQMYETFKATLKL